MFSSVRSEGKTIWSLFLLKLTNFFLNSFFLKLSIPNYYRRKLFLISFFYSSEKIKDLNMKSARLKIDFSKNVFLLNLSLGFPIFKYHFSFLIWSKCFWVNLLNYWLWDKEYLSIIQEKKIKKRYFVSFFSKYKNY